MNIKPLSENNFINFGYNAKYHKKVKNQLSKNNDPKAKLILKYEQDLLDTEDKLVKMEHENKYLSDEYKNLSELVVELKPIIGYFIELMDGSLKYCDELIKNYFEEIKTTKVDQGHKWRLDVCRGLNKYVVKDYFAFEKETKAEENETVKKAEEEEKKTLVNAIKNITNTKKSNPLITLYQPNRYSPTGLHDIVGSEDIKEKLTDDLIYYVQTPEQSEQDYMDYGIRAPRGFLFYGPPGCGKTYITQALAAQAGMDMYMMDVSKVGSMYVNKTSNNVREAFEYVFNLASESQKPVILFMDEVDALAKDRNEPIGGSGENSKTTTTLLKMVEVARDNNVIVIGATNKYDLLDNAFKDRFDEQIYFPLPDKEQIKNLVTTSLLLREKGETLGYDEESIDKIADLLKGFSNRSIVILLDEAAKKARKRSRDSITFDDVKNTIETTELEKHDEKDYIKLSAKKKIIGF